MRPSIPETPAATPPVSETQQALIAAGQGLSYEAVSRDMSGATYSSARQNAIEDESTYAEDVEMLTEFMSEVYETFVISCYLSGLSKCPAFGIKKPNTFPTPGQKRRKNGSTLQRKAMPGKPHCSPGRKRSRISAPNRARTGKKQSMKWPRCWTTAERSESN